MYIFIKAQKPETIYRGAGVTQVKILSEYYPELAGSAANTEIYVLEGKKPGASMLNCTQKVRQYGARRIQKVLENRQIKANTKRISRLISEASLLAN